jgi:hypothetical protein
MEEALASAYSFSMKLKQFMQMTNVESPSASAFCREHDHSGSRLVAKGFSRSMPHL